MGAKPPFCFTENENIFVLSLKRIEVNGRLSGLYKGLNRSLFMFISKVISYLPMQKTETCILTLNKTIKTKLSSLYFRK